MFLDFVKYLFKAKTLHGTHSPFIYQLYLDIFNHDIVLPHHKGIEAFRRKCKANSTTITFHDFGAGGVDKPLSSKTVRSIARNSLKRPKWARAFYRLIKMYEFKVVFELGTSLGVTSAYMASASKDCQIYTFEGSPAVLGIAQNFFEEQGFANISTVLGNIDDQLPLKLQEVESIDLLFIDANHRLEPTIRYFDLCYPKLNEKSMVIFDDIYWSQEMKLAWNQIKSDPRVYQTIDLFEIGIVLFRRSQERENFTLKY